VPFTFNNNSNSNTNNDNSNLIYKALYGRNFTAPGGMADRYSCMSLSKFSAGSSRC